MRPSDSIEKLNPRIIESRDGSRRAVVNGFFYCEKEVELMLHILDFFGVKTHIYNRRNRHEIILQISGDEVINLLQKYKWRDKIKRQKQEMILEEYAYKNDDTSAEPKIEKPPCPCFEDYTRLFNIE